LFNVVDADPGLARPPRSAVPKRTGIP